MNTSNCNPTNKRRGEELLSKVAKRFKIEAKDEYSHEAIEDAVRHYLTRKPMTTTELLTKFRNKKTGLTPEMLVKTMTYVLKKLNPVQQTFQEKLYLSLQTM